MPSSAFERALGRTTNPATMNASHKPDQYALLRQDVCPQRGYDEKGAAEGGGEGNRNQAVEAQASLQPPEASRA